MAQTKATPTAEGYGRFATGGRYEAVWFITSNSNSGTGSLRAALENNSGKIVVFRIGGYIDITSDIAVRVGRSNMTILGMISNGDGICIRGDRLRYIESDNHIIRHIRVRKGHRGADTSVSRDSIDIDKCNNVFADHCSVSWGNDENFSFQRGDNCTMQDCILAEPLNQATETDSPGAHAFNSIWGGTPGSMIRCLMTSGLIRNPSIHTGARADMINCVVYNWNYRATNNGNSCQANLYHNYYKPGPATLAASEIHVARNFLFPTGSSYGKFYLEGNKLQGHSTSPGTLQTIWENVTSDNWLGVRLENGSNQTNFLEDCKNKDEEGNLVPHDIPEGVYEPFMTADEAFEYVLENVGANLHRDAFDERIVNEVQNGTVAGIGSITGLLGIADKPEDFGGYPTLSTTGEILTGSDPHYLPTWFINEYGLNASLNYISAGNPSETPWRFIFFKDGEFVNYKSTSEFPEGFDWEEEIHYNVYEVLSFHVTGEIDLLLSEPPIQEIFTLTVSAQTGGAVSATKNSEPLSLPVDLEEDEQVVLTAIPNSVNWQFAGWFEGETQVSSDNPYTFTMPDRNVTLEARFTFIGQGQGKKFFAKKKNQPIT